MLSAPVHCIKKTLVGKRTALLMFILLSFGAFTVLKVFDVASFCQTPGQRSSEKRQDEIDISPEVLADLKKRWFLEYEEERKLNDNGKLVNGDDSMTDVRQHSPPSKFEPINCIINDDYTVQCLKEKGADENLYMPWSFLQNYYEVYGKLKHDDGYDRFEFSQSYAKVLYDADKPYKYDGVFMTFETYNVETRDRVKCITGVEGVPLSTQWGPQGYFYPIQIAQFGLSHFSKNITGKPPSKTVYENGEMTVQDGWKFDNRNCMIENTFDHDRKSRVIKFTSPVSPTNTNGITLLLGNTMEFELSFDIKFTTNGSVSVMLDTTEEKTYYIHYITDRTLIEFDKDSNIKYGIGSRRKWSHISRDLLTDLRKGVGITNTKAVKKSKIRILKVVKLMLHGDGYIDNITVLTTNHITHFRAASAWLLKNQNHKTGGWPIMVVRTLPGLPPLSPGWHSAMAQGHGLSTMVRAYKVTGDKDYLPALRRALMPYTIPSADGGVRAVFMDKFVWYEEYPTTPSSFVLNGFIFSLLGLYDYKMLLLWQKEQESKRGRRFTSEDGEALQLVSKLYDDGMNSLKNMLPLYDGGSRTIYDLRHFALRQQPNIARWDYHATHMCQMALLSTIDNDPVFKRFLRFWIGYTKGKPAKHN